MQWRGIEEQKETEGVWWLLAKKKLSSTWKTKWERNLRLLCLHSLWHKTRRNTVILSKFCYCTNTKSNFSISCDVSLVTWPTLKGWQDIILLQEIFYDEKSSVLYWFGIDSKLHCGLEVELSPYNQKAVEFDPR